MADLTKFDKPQEVSHAQKVFPANVSHLMPAYDDIPAEFKNSNNGWAKWQSKWFFNGLGSSDVPVPKEGIDVDAALNHLHCIQGSFEPKHEHKSAAVAYLASRWFIAVPESIK